ncbi:organic cation transporter protein [Lingula anatina]|uniref:Organic cation transporter protein n=1 Tax=Lingula anatina TaxID=7574 RepID=A0A1S3KEM7_LINAN|nr:organic cation transporter protein [Lingula anatina]|eukprot:XP_013421078.1 organic cation transporter protein [Lingula anatina]
MAQFDDLLLEIGQVGWYQVLLSFVITIGYEFNTACSMLILMFIGPDPGWTCADNSDVNASMSWNESYTTMLTPSLNTTPTLASSTPVPTISTRDVCKDCTNYKFNKDFTSIVTEWELVCDRDFISDTITSLQMAGVLVGSLFFGQLSDLFGRKKVYFLATTSLCVMGVAQAFATNWILFAACRFGSGVLIGGNIVVGHVYNIEFLGPKYRHIPLTFGLWATSSLILLAMAYFIRDWRHLLLATSVPGFTIIGAWWFVPESPRWLLSKGRFDEVTTIAKRIAKRNKKPQPNMEKFIKAYKNETPNCEPGVKHSYWDLFRTRSLAKCTLIFSLQWFCMSLIGYGAAFNMKNLPGDRFVNMSISFSSGYLIPISVFFLPRWFGRRTICVAGFLISSIAFIPSVVIYIIDKADDLWLLVIILTTIGGTAQGASWNGSILLVTETYPTAIRNIGLGFASMSARFGGILAPQMAYFGTFWAPIPFVMSAAFAFLSGIASLYLKETKNKILVDEVPDRECCLCCPLKKEDDDKMDDKEFVTVTEL